MLDVIISVALGLLTLGTAYLGVHVTLHPAESPREKRAYKIGFIVCGLITCALIGVQAERNTATQQQLQADIGRIQHNTQQLEHNTQQPPNVHVTNNVPIPGVTFGIPLSHDHGPTGPGEQNNALATLTNSQLKAQTIALAGRMRAFESDTADRISRYSSQIVGDERTEQQKRTAANAVTIYDDTLLKDAVAFRSELWRRVGAVNPDERHPRMDAFQTISADEVINIQSGFITDAALYLEKLASKLPK